MTKPGEWIEWSGGECPVEPTTLVVVEFRDGAISPQGFARTWQGPEGRRDEAMYSCWRHDDGDNDIIAYHVVQP